MVKAGQRQQGQAQHSHNPAQGGRRVKGLSLNATPGQGLEAQVRLIRTIRAYWGMQGPKDSNSNLSALLYYHCPSAGGVCILFLYFSGGW